MTNERIEYVPAEKAAAYVRKLRGKTLFIGGNAFLYSEEPEEGTELRRGYTMPVHVRVTQRVALELVADWRGFSERKRERGQAPALIRIAVYNTCAFIGS